MVLRKIGKLLLFGIAGVVGLTLLLMLAVKLAFDRAPQYQAQIKNWVHDRIGYHIAFANVSPAFRWYGPELYLDRLQLRSKDDQRVLAEARGGRVGVDLWHLFRSGRLFAARIELDALTISVERVASDKFALASEIELGGEDSSIAARRLDDLPAGTLAIRHGLVTVRNWNADLPRVDLRDVNITLRRGDGGATLAFGAALPVALGGQLNIRATADGRGRLDTLKWSALARARDLSFAGWRKLAPQYLERLDAGSGGFEVVARGQGAELQRADLDFEAANVTTHLTDEPPVTFDQIGGAFTLTHAMDRWTLVGQHVRALRAGHRDPDSEFNVNWRGSDDGLTELHGRASYLRAETLLPLAGFLPQNDLRERLQEAALTGEWMDTRVDLGRSAAGDPLKLNVQASFRGVGFAPAGHAPGLRGLNGTLVGNESGGRIDIDTHQAVLNWPAQFTQPIDVQRFKTTLYWKRTAREFLVATPALEVKTRDAVASGQFAWHQLADGDSPELVLVSGVDNGNVANARLYLPRLHIAPKALAWLNRAFVAGHLSHADVVIQGPVRHFPFRDGTGLFLARAHIDGMTLDYKEGWPRADDLAVLAEFRNEGVTLSLQRGRIGALMFDKGDARFADFKTAELELRVSAGGDAANALAFLRATPLDASADHAFSNVEAKGPMRADVDLFLPFKQFDHRHTLVHAHMLGVALNEPSSHLVATDLMGDADVDGAQIARADVRGKLLGGAFQIQARAPRNRPVTRTILVFNGTMSGDALHSALSLPSSIPLDGSTDWHGVLRMASEPSRERSLRVSASLAGLALDLPDPLAKPAGTPMPSSVEVQWPASGSPQVRLRLGSVLRAQATIDSDANGPTLGRLALTFGTKSAAEPAFSESQVVNTGGAIDRLDLAGWLKLYSPDKNAKPIGSFFRSAKFEVTQLDYLGLSFFDVTLDVALNEGSWRVGIGGPNVVGSLSMPATADSGEPWKLEFQRLKFFNAAEPGKALNGQQDPPFSGSGNPRGIPSLEFHAADLIWDDRQLGDVRATLRKLDDGISLKQLTVSGADFSATAAGDWRGKDGGVARVAGSLTSTDVGAAMKDLGYDAGIEAKTGKMDFDLDWLGAPTGRALSLATGHLQVALDKGQLTGIKPGAGRVVGLTSLAALPRHLSLDFSDLTDKGLAFDTIRGDFDLHDGSAFTDNVLVKGPAAEIGLIGRVGLKNRDYDQTAVVTGNVSSTLPLAAFVAGPVIGGAVLLFSQVFKQPLKGLARGYYRITGSWDNPAVERIKSADAAAATAEAPK